MASLLIVDDEKNIQITLAAFLKAAGHEVQAAEDAAAAELLLSKTKFDIVIVDIVLPRVSGVELLERIRFISPHSLVLMMTGEPTVETAVRAVRAGAYDYLTKPIYKNVILRAVERALEHGNLRQQKERLEAANREYQKRLETMVEMRTRALSRSGVLYHSLVENLPQGVFRKDAEGRFTFANSYFCNLIGRSVNEVNGRSSFDIWPEALAAQYVKDDARVLATGEKVEAVAEYCFPGGVKRLIRSVSTPLRDRPGQISGLQCILDDVTAEKRTEEQLRKLSRAVEQSPSSILITDPEGRIEYVNPKFTEVTGYTLAEMAGSTPRILKGGETSAAEYEDMWRTIKAGREWRGEFHNRKKNGQYFWEHASISPITDGAGRITHFLAVKEDITARRHAEEALRVSEERLRLAAEAARLGTWERDLVTDRLSWSVMLEQLNGYEPGTFPGTDEALKALLHPDSIERLKQVQQQWRNGAEAFQAELHFLLRDGRDRWGLVCGRAIRDRAGTLQRLVGIDFDITASKQREAALRLSEERLRLAVEGAGLGTWHWEVVTDRFVCSEPCQKIFDFPGGAGATFAHFLKCVHSDDRVRVDQKTRWCLVHDADYQIEFRAVRSDKTVRWLRAKGRGFYDPSGAPVRMEGVVMDVTKDRELEDRLRQAQKLESIGQLAGGVAHDFNNILSSTMLRLGLLQDNSSLTPDVQETIRELQAEAQRAATLTRQLLIFSRRSVLNIKCLDLNLVIENVLKMLRRLIGENIQVIFEPDPELPFIPADSGMMEQVLLNLTVNARDAMPNGGRIVIRTAGVRLAEEQLQQHPGSELNGMVCLSVSDTGCGMDDATRVRIFEPFFTTKEVGKGTGLGLATVHGIVTQHKGWIEVESQPGLGSTFSVLLPHSGRDTPSPGVDEPVEAVQRGSGTVLLVEDEPNLRRVVQRALESLGYRTLEAAEPQEALRIWDQHGPDIDVVFTDMVMPGGLTGLDLCKLLRKNKPELKVILSTGYSSEMPGQQESGISGMVWLLKPYKVAALARILRDCLND